MVHALHRGNTRRSRRISSLAVASAAALVLGLSGLGVAALNRVGVRAAWAQSAADLARAAPVGVFTLEEAQDLPTVQPQRPLPAAVEAKVRALAEQYARTREGTEAPPALTALTDLESATTAPEDLVLPDAVGATESDTLIDPPDDPHAPPRMDSGDADPDRVRTERFTSD